MLYIYILNSICILIGNIYITMFKIDKNKPLVRSNIESKEEQIVNNKSLEEYYLRADPLLTLIIHLW